MCGRYVLYGPENRIIEGFSLFEPPLFARPLSLPPLKPRFNIAPTTEVGVIVADAEGHRHWRTMRWGLIPGWAKDPSIGAKLNNARSETVSEKPSFRNAFRRWRCLIPANGYYEWKTIETGGKPRKLPYYIHAPEGGLLAMAGLTERWIGPDGPVYSCCVLTTEPNGVMKPIHERMPVILSPDVFEHWLSSAVSKPEQLLPLLRPCPDEWLHAHRVSTAANNARNDEESLIVPVAEETN